MACQADKFQAFLTESELRRLQSLKIPSALLPPIRLVGQNDFSRPWKGIPASIVHSLFRPFSSRTQLRLSLEGKRLFRLQADPEVLVVVGEDLCCVHLPKVGTQWRSSQGIRFARSPRLVALFWLSQFSRFHRTKLLRQLGRISWPFPLLYPKSAFKGQTSLEMPAAIAGVTHRLE